MDPLVTIVVVVASTMSIHMKMNGWIHRVQIDPTLAPRRLSCPRVHVVVGIGLGVEYSPEHDVGSSQQSIPSEDTPTEALQHIACHQPVSNRLITSSTGKGRGEEDDP